MVVIYIVVCTLKIYQFQDYPSFDIPPKFLLKNLHALLSGNFLVPLDIDLCGITGHSFIVNKEPKVHPYVQVCIPIPIIIPVKITAFDRLSKTLAALDYEGEEE
jgi:hypothetical protein